MKVKIYILAVFIAITTLFASGEYAHAFLEKSESISKNFNFDVNDGVNSPRDISKGIVTVNYTMGVIGNSDLNKCVGELINFKYDDEFTFTASGGNWDTPNAYWCSEINTLCKSIYNGVEVDDASHPESSKSAWILWTGKKYPSAGGYLSYIVSSNPSVVQCDHLSCEAVGDGTVTLTAKARPAQARIWAYVKYSNGWWWASEDPPGKSYLNNSFTNKMWLSESNTTIGSWTVTVGQANRCEYCGDGNFSSDELCDTTDPNNEYSVDDCAVGYGEMCEYCVSPGNVNECTIVTKEGPYCGDGVTNGNEDCDSVPGCLSNCEYVIGQCTSGSPYTYSWDIVEWPSLEDLYFCLAGTPNFVPLRSNFPGYGETKTWGCDGGNVSTSTASDACSASRNIPPPCSCDSGVTTGIAPFNQTQAEWDAQTFCASGEPLGGNPAQPPQGGSVTWTCGGADCVDPDAECSASRAEPPSCECGSAHTTVQENEPSGTMLCSPGNVTAVLSNNGQWQWNCNEDPTSVCKDSAGPCWANCVELDIDMKTSIFLTKNENNEKLDINISIKTGENNVQAGGTCLIEADNNENQTVTLLDGKAKAEIELQGKARVKVTCTLNVDCKGGDDYSEVTIEETRFVQSMCASKSCNAQGTCQSTPVQADSLDEPQCKSSCNSNSDCTRGRLIETKP